MPPKRKRTEAAPTHPDPPPTVPGTTRKNTASAAAAPIRSTITRRWKTFTNSRNQHLRIRSPGDYTAAELQLLQQQHQSRDLATAAVNLHEIDRYGDPRALAINDLAWLTGDQIFRREQDPPLHYRDAFTGPFIVPPGLPARMTQEVRELFVNSEQEQREREAAELEQERRMREEARREWDRQRVEVVMPLWEVVGGRFVRQGKGGVEGGQQQMGQGSAAVIGPTQQMGQQMGQGPAALSSGRFRALQPRDGG